MPFLILFVLIPLCEIFVFISVSDHIGLGTSLLLALFTAILGGFLVKYQGVQTLMSAQDSLRSGGLPSKQLFDGLCIVAAGATLITPGFITDAIGFALLVPAFRDFLREKVGKSARFSTMEFNSEYSEFHEAKDYHRPQDPDVIDAEFETVEVDRQDKDKP